MDKMALKLALVMACLVACSLTADTLLDNRPVLGGEDLDGKVYIGDTDFRDRNTFLENWNGDKWPFCTNVVNFDTETLKGDSICSLKTGDALEHFEEWYPVLAERCEDGSPDGVSCAQLSPEEVCTSQTAATALANLFGSFDGDGKLTQPTGFFDGFGISGYNLPNSPPITGFPPDSAKKRMFARSNSTAHARRADSVFSWGIAKQGFSIVVDVVFCPGCYEFDAGGTADVPFGVKVSLAATVDGVSYKFSGTRYMPTCDSGLACATQPDIEEDDRLDYVFDSGCQDVCAGDDYGCCIYPDAYYETMGSSDKTFCSSQPVTCADCVIGGYPWTDAGCTDFLDINTWTNWGNSKAFLIAPSSYGNTYPFVEVALPTLGITASIKMDGTTEIYNYVVFLGK